ncbi:MAG: D-alanyl-D-alanine carboxypeptidase [Bacteriovorax sp.]|nr:D-alanyl-D-alanine carboxypeptidase [Bacteriovorax sp.]
MEFENVLKKNLAALILVVMSAQAFSSEKTDATWEQLLAANKLPAVDQSYCYTDEHGKMFGENLDIRVRLASVSKLLTSLWAVEKLGINYKYRTKLFIKGSNLHIQGSLDPFLGNEKMFFLLSQLNDLGYSKFDTITFDKIIQINPSVAVHSDQYPLITRASNARNLKMYFNTNSWSPDLKAEYTRIASLAPKGKFRPVIHFEIGNAQYVDTNPYENNHEAKILTLSSPVLYKYLKEINVQSNNYAAHTIFLQLGGAVEFEKFISDRYGKTSNSIHFYTGSGLPSVVDGIRRDNYATCATTIELIAALKESTERQGKKLEDLVAVPGSDAGTFSNRIFPADYKNAFVAKTGTLMHTSTLAGAMSTQKGFSFYGIFNQSTDIEGSKIVQNGMVKSVMTEMDGPLAFNYVVDPFHPYNGDNVKNLEFFNPSTPSEFTTIEENLY